MTKIKNYTYDEATQIYTTEIKIEGTIYEANITKSAHEFLRRAYSNWNGEEETLEAIAKRFGQTKAWLNAYKTKHGWTRDISPFTDEEIQTKTLDELTDDLLQQKRNNLEKNILNYEQKQLYEDAEKWRNLETSFLNPLSEIAASANYKPPQLNFELGEPFTFILGCVDLHFGKAGYSDEVLDSYSRSKTKDRLFNTTEKLLKRMMCYGTPSKIIFPAANDFLHIDSHLGTTTKGTPQDLDGTSGIILKEGFKLAADYVSYLRNFTSNVEILYIPDNHSRLMGQALVEYLSGYFRNDNGVTIDNGLFPRKYRLEGNTLCAFEHNLRKETPMQMAGEASVLWGKSKYRAAFGGHLHHEGLRSIDENGVLIYKLPSISGDDRYHTDEGYTLSRKSMGGYIIDYEEGPIASIFSPAN